MANSLIRWRALPLDVRQDISGKLAGLWGAPTDEAAFDDIARDGGPGKGRLHRNAESVEAIDGQAAHHAVGRCDVQPVCARTGAAAVVRRVAARAGVIASSIGSAMAAPMPRRNVRRGRCLRVTIMALALLVFPARGAPPPLAWLVSLRSLATSAPGLLARPSASGRAGC